MCGNMRAPQTNVSLPAPSPAAIPLLLLNEPPPNHPPRSVTFGALTSDLSRLSLSLSLSLSPSLSLSLSICPFRWGPTLPPRCLRDRCAIEPLRRCAVDIPIRSTSSHTHPLRHSSVDTKYAQSSDWSNSLTPSHSLTNRRPRRSSHIRSARTAMASSRRRTGRGEASGRVRGWAVGWCHVGIWRDMEGYGASAQWRCYPNYRSSHSTQPQSRTIFQPSPYLELNKIHNKLPLSLPLRRLSINSTAASWAASLLSSNATYESRYGLGSNRR